MYILRYKKEMETLEETFSIQAIFTEVSKISCVL